MLQSNAATGCEGVGVGALVGTEVEGALVGARVGASVGSLVGIGVGEVVYMYSFLVVYVHF